MRRLESKLEVNWRKHADALIELLKSPYVFGIWPINRLRGQVAFHHSGMGSGVGHVLPCRCAFTRSKTSLRVKAPSKDREPSTQPLAVRPLSIELRTRKPRMTFSNLAWLETLEDGLHGCIYRDACSGNVSLEVSYRSLI
jgi:hypothetical protein